MKIYMKFMGVEEKAGRTYVKISAGTGLFLCTMSRILMCRWNLTDGIFDICCTNGILLTFLVFFSQWKDTWTKRLFPFSFLCIIHLMDIFVWKSIRWKWIFLSMFLLFLCVFSTVRYIHFFKSRYEIKKSYQGDQMADWFSRLLLVLYYFLTVVFVIVVSSDKVSSGFLEYGCLTVIILFFIFLMIRDFNPFKLQKEPEELSDTIVIHGDVLPDKEIEPAMKQLYDRFCVYMSEQQPFLSESCQVDEVARELFTNKTYLSKMVNLCTGLNFPKLINQYRVRYSMELYKRDMHLKVSELSEMSGFHSNVTYNMAFKYFMNLSPSEWCREYRESID